MNGKLLIKAFCLAAILGAFTYASYNSYQYNKCMEDQKARYRGLMIVLTVGESRCNSLADMPQEQENCFVSLKSTIETELDKARAEFTKRGCVVNE